MLRAVEEVCLGTLGTIRTQTDGLLRDAYAAIDDVTLAQRAVVSRRFEIEIVSSDRTGVVGPPSADRAVVAYDLRIAVVVTTLSEVEADLRRAVRGLCANIADRTRQALLWPGNLTQTTAAVATGLISGCLAKVGPARVTRDDWKARIYRCEMPARGLVLVSQSVS